MYNSNNDFMLLTSLVKCFKNEIETKQLQNKKVIEGLKCLEKTFCPLMDFETALFLHIDKFNVEQEEYLHDWEDQDLVPYKSSLMKKLKAFLQH